MEVDPGAAQPDELAPAHPAVDGQVDERPAPVGDGLGQVDALLPGEERHLPLRDPWRLDPVTGVGRDALLLDRHLQHAAQRAEVAVDRGRGEAVGDLVEEPGLDLVGREPAEPVGAEAREDVAPQVAGVGLLGGRRQPAGEGEELLGPVGQRRVGAGRVDPAAPLDVDLHLAQEPVGVGLAGEGLASLPPERVAVAGPVPAVALLDEPHVVRLFEPQGACGEHAGSETRGFRG